MVNSTQWQIETADLDYQYEQYEMKHFTIDRSDSMEEDNVRISTEPKVTIHKGHKVRYDSWVNTYDKFLNQLFVVLFGMFMMSCTTEIIPDTYESVPTATSAPNILDGDYEVAYKIHEAVDGSTMLFTYEDSPYWEERDGQIAPMRLTFGADSLRISQLMSNGWTEGSVKLKWKNGIPTQVGCKEVVYSSENEIHWMQNDVIIKNFLIKL